MAIINGTGSDDTLNGGAGNDTITGGLGNDLAFMGGGNDVFVWNAGDGNDTVEGQGGLDTLRFVTNSTAELFDLSANGTRARLLRDVGGIVMDLDDVERVELAVGGSPDIIRIQDLAGTDVKQVAIDLAGGFLPGFPDGAVDHIFQFGRTGDDKFNIALVNGLVTVTGPSAKLTIDNADANDVLHIQGDEGNDVIDASKLTAGVMSLVLDGGSGNDKITGSKGADTLYGSDGNDVVAGNGGNDKVNLDNGDDLFSWSAGDGLDVVNGSAGVDSVRFAGSAVHDQIDIWSDNGYALLAHNSIVSVAAQDVEKLQLRALGGADHVIIGDLSATDVTQVAVDLAATAGGKAVDPAIDSVLLHGRGSDDVVDVSWTGSAVRVAGLAAEVTVEHAGANDFLTIKGADGNDVLNAAGLLAGKISLQLYGGYGNDAIFGSAGNDGVFGNAGDDVAYLGAGNDEFQWMAGDGNDKVDGQLGFDTVKLASNIGPNNEAFYIGSSGEQATISTLGGSLTLNDVERIQLSTFGGSDDINLFDLTGTDVKQLAIDLGVAGAGDNQLDTIYAAGFAGDNKITIAMAGGNVLVSGLPTQLTIAHADTIDRLVLSGGDGNDVIKAATLPATAIQLTLNGGDGNDVITGNGGDNGLNGGDGFDTLRGGAGADSMTGGSGNDYMDGGVGNDRVDGGAGEDVILGGLGDDLIIGGWNDDTITGGAGNDTFKCESVLDGRDLILDFDGDALGGQDVLNLDYLFDILGVANGDRAGRVELTDNGGTVDVRVNADGSGGNGFELHVATLTTAHEITLGQDVILVA